MTMNYTQVKAAMAKHAPFEGNTMTGVTGAPYSVGYLNHAETEQYKNDWTQITYVVLSYRTPIAWVLGDGTVHLVNQKFSATTSKHQSYAKAALT